MALLPCFRGFLRALKPVLDLFYSNLMGRKGMYRQLNMSVAIKLSQHNMAVSVMPGHEVIKALRSRKTQ